MSAFWKYFAETLRWPQIHGVGALQAFTRGLATHFDATRDDALYLREQFFPAKAEPAILPSHGDSRGITRHPTETDAQFRARVVHAWRWHNLGGKTLGLPEILAFYGFHTLKVDNLRQWVPSRWAEFQVGLATPEDPAAQAAMLENLADLVWAINEYKPARSILSRIYNDSYNLHPAVWSVDSWGCGLWSDFSGTHIPNLDDDLIVSFGARLSLTCPPLVPLFASGMASLMSCLAPYLDKPVWGRTRWGGIMPVNLPFIFSQLYGSYFGTAFFDPPRIDRSRPEWRMGDESVSRSQAVWGESGKNWGDTAVYGTVIVRHIDTPAVYSLATYGDSQGLRFEVLHELSQNRAVFLLPAWGVGVPIFGTAGRSAFLVPRRAVPVWGESAWGDIFAGNKPFFGQSLFSGCFGDRLTQARKWRGAWRGPWRKFIGFGRKRPPWSMNADAVSRSQSVFGETAKAWGDGTRYGTTVARRIEAPAVYGAAAYGDSQDLKIEIIHDI